MQIKIDNVVYIVIKLWYVNDKVQILSGNNLSKSINFT